MFKTIPQTSIEQQQSEQQVFDLEKCQEQENRRRINFLKMIFEKKKSFSYSSSIIASRLEAPRGLRDRVAVKTTVNCIKLHDQIDNVKNTKMGSSAIFLSLNESKNSMMSAAVPRNIFTLERIEPTKSSSL